MSGLRPSAVHLVPSIVSHFVGVQVACHIVVRSQLYQRWLNLLTDVHDVRASRVESTAYGRIEKVGGLTWYGRQSFTFASNIWKRLQQTLSVRVQRLVEDTWSTTILGNVSCIHDHDPFAGLSYYRHFETSLSWVLIASIIWSPILYTGSRAFIAP